MKKEIKDSKGRILNVITGGDETLYDNEKKNKAKAKNASVNDKLDYIIELLES